MEWTFVLICGALVAVVFALKQIGLARPRTARLHLRERGAVVIDVRSEAEYRRGHLPGVINVPLDRLREGIGRHAPEKNRAVLLHCASGTRSGLARRWLQEMGYQTVFNLGGYRRAARILKGKV